MTYEKVEFVLDAPAAVDVESTLRFEPATAVDAEQRLLDAVAAVVAASLDRADQRSVARVGPEAAARRYLLPDPYFAFDRAWWHLAYASDGALIGFTQPVLFRDGARGGLPEGTIHYIGVVPSARGCGHLHALLRHATTTLQHIGVWRILCDTDVLNVPMIRAFEHAGYRRGRIRDVAFHD